MEILALTIVMDTLQEEAHVKSVNQMLEGYPFIEKYQIERTRERSGGPEVLAIIGISILVVRGSRLIIEELRRFLVALKLLIKECKCKEIYIEQPNARVPVSKTDLEECVKIMLSPNSNP